MFFLFVLFVFGHSSGFGVKEDAVSPLRSFSLLGKVFNFSKPQYSHVENGDDNTFPEGCEGYKIYVKPLNRISGASKTNFKTFAY